MLKIIIDLFLRCRNEKFQELCRKWEEEEIREAKKDAETKRETAWRGKNDKEAKNIDRGWLREERHTQWELEIFKRKESKGVEIKY